MVAPVFHARSLTELVALRAETQADEPFVHTGAPEFGDQLLTLTYADVQRAVDRLAAYYASLGLRLPEGDDPPERVIAVLVSTAVDESLLEIALAKLGLTSLLLSVNNSAEAVAHLCKETGASHLIHGPKYAHVAAEAARILAESDPAASDKADSHTPSAQSSSNSPHSSYTFHDASIPNGVGNHASSTPSTPNGSAGHTTATTADKTPKGRLQLIEDKRFPLWGPNGVRSTKICPFSARLTPEQESRRTCVILHSSGSTGFPKPVFVTHYGMVANAAVSVPKTGFSALPLYHGFGHFSIFRCLYHGKAFTLLPPHWPITASNIVRCIESSPTPPVQHFAVPYVLKLLAESPAGVKSLASMEAVSFAGAALPDELGDRLVEAGVPLYSQYGTTETGALLTSRRDYSQDKAWNWLRVEGLVASYLDLVPRGGGTYEAVVKDGWPGKVMSNREDGAYCTKDLFVRHPEHYNWVKYVGRMDDTLTLTLGEKTNPVPIELDIRGNSPLIQECIVFGDGRPQVGALLLPSDAGAELSRNRSAYLEAVWPVIAAANARAPSHSRLLPEMIHILDPGTEVPVATKMSILRPTCYRQFASIIDSVYERFEGGGGEDKRLIEDSGEMETYLLSLLSKTLGKKGKEVDRTTDLFAFGVDSLQATRVRNTIQKELQLGRTLGQNVVYEHPSVAKLAEHILSLSSSPDKASDVAEEMCQMAAKWTARVARPSTGTLPTPTSHTILVTGATGSLGAHTVARLLTRPNTRVICLSRASSHAESALRLKASFTARRICADWSRIESLAADLSQPELGLTECEYAHLQRQVTGVIHLAWPVNFAAALGSFEPSVAGAVNLLNLTQGSPLASKPGFFFASSVGAVQASEGEITEVFSNDPDQAGGTGYARSKWVVERLLARTGGTVLRIGQLVGDSQHGIWNETEAWPLMFRSGVSLGVLPDLEEQVGWLPVDLAAEAIAEAAIASSPSQSSPSSTSSTSSTSGAPSSDEKEGRVLYILNRHTTPFSNILAALRASGLTFKTVSRREWLDRLAASDPDVSRNPTRKLLPFYEARIGGSEERRQPVFDTRVAEERCGIMRGLKGVDAELVGKWVETWRESGFLPDQRANGH